MLPFDERLGGLLRAAARVFARKGYHATTMRDLSRESGMSLAGMYHYVRGKEDLLYQIQQRCFAGVLSGAEAAVTRQTGADEQLRAFVRHHLAYFAAQPAEMKVLTHEADSLTGKRADDIRRLKRRYATMLQELVQEAGGSDPSVDAYALFGMMNWTYTWYQPTGRLPPERLADVFADLFLDGARAAHHTPASASRENARD